MMTNYVIVAPGKEGPECPACLSQAGTRSPAARVAPGREPGRMQVVLGPEGGSERGPEPGQGATCRRLDSSPDTRGHLGILAPALQGNRGRLRRGQGPGRMEQGRQAPAKPPFQCPRPAKSCPSRHQAPS